MIIETRESYQPLLKSNSPPSPGGRKKRQSAASSVSSAPAPSYGTLKGEALLRGDYQVLGAHDEAPSGYGNDDRVSPTPQSIESAHYNEYAQQVSGAAPAANAPPGLPPAIPLRRRVDSFGDRSVGELSTVSGTSGQNRLQRSTSAPRPPRSRSPAPTDHQSFANGGPGRAPAPPQAQAGHPLHRRRPSEERPGTQTHAGPGSHRRFRSDHSGHREQGLRRGSSSNSLYSLSNSSQASEGLRLLPDPRWGGGGPRVRSYSNGSRGGSPRDAHAPHSADSLEQGARCPPPGYGSTKEVITNGLVFGAALGPRHRRADSEISASTHASVASVDRSVEPAVTDMTKSSMFAGVTDEGLIRMQLPKDGFRLLSDRDLESGRVYKRELVGNEDDYFQEYHLEVDLDGVPGSCQRPDKRLPPSYYVMAVDPDIYRRMFDEVIESQNMPCKLFYCGHHPDVDYPSIGIAIVGVSAVFLVMLWATIVVEG